MSLLFSGFLGLPLLLVHCSLRAPYSMVLLLFVEIVMHHSAFLRLLFPRQSPVLPFFLSCLLFVVFSPLFHTAKNSSFSSRVSSAFFFSLSLFHVPSASVSAPTSLSSMIPLLSHLFLLSLSWLPRSSFSSLFISITLQSPLDCDFPIQVFPLLWLARSFFAFFLFPSY